MPSLDWNEVILSDNTILYSDILSNLPRKKARLFLLQNKSQTNSFLQAHGKINVLLIDNAQEIDKKILNISQNIISLNSLYDYKNVIYMRKPLSLFKLLKEISALYSKTNIFCFINGKLLYNQSESSFFLADNKITLSNKENQIISTLLTAEGYCLAKDKLLDLIWNYSDQIRTNTLETHLYNLKQKLLGQLISMNNGIVSLDIECIE